MRPWPDTDGAGAGGWGVRYGGREWSYGWAAISVKTFFRAKRKHVWRAFCLRRVRSLRADFGHRRLAVPSGPVLLLVSAALVLGDRLCLGGISYLSWRHKMGGGNRAR